MECLQILNVLCNKNYRYPLNDTKSNVPWGGHPAVKMWWTYENHLVDYGIAVCNEWISRGFKDTCKDKIIKHQKLAPNGFKGMPVQWLGDEKFHLSHKSNLIRKNPEYYRPIFGIDIPDNLPYIWPSKENL